MKKQIAEIIALAAAAAALFFAADITRSAFIQAFLWAADERLSGGQCMVLFALVLAPLTAIAFLVIRFFRR